MGMRWTAADIAELRQMADRYPLPLVAEKMDRTVGSITYKARQLRLALRPRGRAVEQGFSTDPGAGFGHEI